MANRNSVINMVENGYDYQYLIILNKNKELLDGSHRLFLCLYHNIQQLPVIVCDNEASIDYSLEWFINNGLQQLKKYILDKYKEVVQTCQKHTKDRTCKTRLTEYFKLLFNPFDFNANNLFAL